MSDTIVTGLHAEDVPGIVPSLRRLPERAKAWTECQELLRLLGSRRGRRLSRPFYSSLRSAGWILAFLLLTVVTDVGVTLLAQELRLASTVR